MKIVKPLIFILVAALFGVGMWQGVVKTDLLKVKSIRIEGASHATELRLQNILTVKPGESLWAKSVDKQAVALKKDPWVESAQVRRVFPNTLVIEITEKTPVAVIGNTKGTFKYIDKNSDIIDVAPADKISKLPIMLGRELEINANLRSQALNIIKSLPDEGLLSRKDLSDLDFDSEHGFQIRLAKSGMLIDIGKDNIPLHLDRARRVVQYLDQHSVNASRVDSDYAKKVLVKVRKGR